MRLYSVSDKYINYLKNNYPRIYSNKEDSRIHTRKYLGAVIWFYRFTLCDSGGDSLKREKGIQVIIYTFTKNNPSYANSKYHINDIGLHYNEKQICVTSNEAIIKKVLVEKFDSFGEVII